MREHLLCEILCQWIHAWKLMRVQELRTNLEKMASISLLQFQLNAMPRSGSSLYLIFYTLLLLSARLSICFSDLVKLWPYLTYSLTWTCSEGVQVAFQLHELMYFQTYTRSSLPYGTSLNTVSSDKKWQNRVQDFIIAIVFVLCLNERRSFIVLRFWCKDVQGLHCVTISHFNFL